MDFLRILHQISVLEALFYTQAWQVKVLYLLFHKCKAYYVGGIKTNCCRKSELNLPLLENYLVALPTQLGLIADPVIEAIARLEFEDGMRTGVLLGGCWGP